MQTVSLQSGSGQDYAVSGYVGDMQYIAVMDGHGSNKCIDFIRKLNFDDVASAPNPALDLWKKVESAGNLFKSGSTLTFARITNKIELWNVGDSVTTVYINDQHVYTTPTHTFMNPDEIDRTRHLVSIRSGKAPFPVSDTRIENVESPVGIFSNGESLVPSQSYGHNGITGIKPYEKQIDFNPTDKIRIVCGSDGLHDMLVDVKTGTAQELVNEAEKRWRKNWQYYDGYSICTTGYGDCIDDISCAIWENKIVHVPSVSVYTSPLFIPSEILEVFNFANLEKITEVDTGDRKLFLLYFNPSERNDTMREMFAKEEYTLNGWNVRVLGNVKPVGWQYARWNGEGNYDEFAEDQIEDKVCARMTPLF